MNPIYSTVTVFAVHLDEVAEYCTGEAFEPRCTGSDVIVLLSARYGRMKVGRCVEVEPGFEVMLEDRRYLGCSTNVLDVVSRQCLGRSACTLRVNDQTFDNVHSCYTSLIKYLEVAYMCISGKLMFHFFVREVSNTVPALYNVSDKKRKPPWS